VVDLGFVESKVMENLLPNRLLADVRQREVYSVQGHPIQLSFPAAPVPPRERIAEGANILVISVSEQNTSSFRVVQVSAYDFQD